MSQEKKAGLANDPRLLLVGQIVAAHGLKGGVRVHCSESARDKFLGLSSVRAQVDFPDATHEQQIVGVQQNKGCLILYFEDAFDRNSAESLVGGEVFVKRDDLPALEDDEWWTKDLIGFAAYTLDGKLIGTVCDIIAIGNSLLEVQPADPSRKGTILIPFVKEMVPNVNMAERRIDVNPLPGLLDL